MPTCLNCKKPFEAKRSTAKFCSDVCRSAYAKKSAKFEKEVNRVANTNKYKKASKEGFENLIDAGTSVVHVPTLVTGTNLNEVVEKVKKEMAEKKKNPPPMRGPYMNETIRKKLYGK